MSFVTGKEFLASDLLLHFDRRKRSKSEGYTHNFEYTRRCSIRYLGNFPALIVFESNLSDIVDISINALKQKCLIGTVESV